MLTLILMKFSLFANCTKIVEQPAAVLLWRDEGDLQGTDPLRWSDEKVHDEGPPLGLAVTLGVG